MFYGTIYIVRFIPICEVTDLSQKPNQTDTSLDALVLSARQGDDNAFAALAAERTALLEYFELLGNIAGRCGIDKAAGRTALVRVSPAEAVRTMEITGRGKEALLQNCSVELVQSWVCMELSAVFGGNL